MSTPYFIYGLHGSDGLIRYVGRSRWPYRRLRDHQRLRYSMTNNEASGWLRSEGDALRMVVLDVAESLTGSAEERSWIWRLSRRLPLLNYLGTRVLPPVLVP